MMTINTHSRAPRRPAATRSFAAIAAAFLAAALLGCPVVPCASPAAHAAEVAPVPITTPARAWTPVSGETLPTTAEGLTHQRQTVRGPGGTEATLHFLSFDAANFTFRLLDQGSLGRTRLDEALRTGGCLAGTNGGYFQPDFEPVGLLFIDGKTIHPVHHARLLSGALVVTTNHIALRRSVQPLPGKHARHALQSGPFLVENGHALPGLNAARTARRTAVFTDGARRWGLVSCSRVTLAELGAILAEPGALPGGMKVSAALNLDGGSSTGMWAQGPGEGGGGEPFYLREFGIVRDFVGIVRRQP